MIDEVDGLLLVDKPEGPTSHDVVASVRRRLGGARTGHAGTLDPLATGLLPLVVGRATRLVGYLPQDPKTYVGEIALGVATTTDDVTGAVLARHDGPLPPRDDVLQAAHGLRGRIDQVPPAYSARRVGGVRLYRKARRGEIVEAPPTTVGVSRFDLAPTGSPAIWRFTVEVTSGTYVRALARDLGARLGCGGTLKALRRIAIGPLRVEDAVAVDPARPPDRPTLVAALIPLAGLPLTPPPVSLDDGAARRFLAGVAVRPLGAAPQDGTVSAWAPDGRLLGIGEARAGVVAPRVAIRDRPESLPPSSPM